MKILLSLASILVLAVVITFVACGDDTTTPDPTPTTTTTTTPTTTTDPADQNPVLGTWVYEKTNADGKLTETIIFSSSTLTWDERQTNGAGDCMWFVKSYADYVVDTSAKTINIVWTKEEENEEDGDCSSFSTSAGKEPDDYDYSIVGSNLILDGTYTYTKQ